MTGVREYDDLKRERYCSVKISTTILLWIGRIIVMITADYGIGEYALEPANRDHRQNATINFFYVGYNFQRNIIAYIKLRAIAIGIVWIVVNIYDDVTTGWFWSVALPPSNEAPIAESKYDTSCLALLYHPNFRRNRFNHRLPDRADCLIKSWQLPIASPLVGALCSVCGDSSQLLRLTITTILSEKMSDVAMECGGAD
jgi:hypothetical protein